MDDDDDDDEDEVEEEDNDDDDDDAGRWRGARASSLYRWWDVWRVVVVRWSASQSSETEEDSEGGGGDGTTTMEEDDPPEAGGDRRRTPLASLLVSAVVGSMTSRVGEIILLYSPTCVRSSSNKRKESWPNNNYYAPIAFYLCAVGASSAAIPPIGMMMC